MSKEAQHYLGIYTNNLWFHEVMVFMKGIGDEPIYAVSNAKGKVRKGSKGAQKQNQSKMTNALSMRAFNL